LSIGDEILFKYYLLLVDTKFRMGCNTTIQIQSVIAYVGLHCHSVMQSYRLTADLSATSLLSKTFTKSPYSV